MSEDSLAASSFGDPNAQPLTPNQTPTSTAFPSPVYETPKPFQGSLPEPGGLTPRFAEEYSVFNATPGNLRGTQGTFPDFAASSSVPSSIGHKRQLSTDSVLVEIAAAHVDQFSSSPSAPRPPANPTRPSPSSPGPYAVEPSSSSSICRSSILTKTPTSSKRARRGGSSIPDIEPTQIISPPPTGRKGERRLAPKPSMQNDPGVGHVDFADPLPQDMTAFMDNVGDMFGYPMTAPASTQPNFWDPSVGMGIDLDFTTSGNDLFQPAASSHRHTGSFDWNTDLQLFQDSNILPSSNQENVQPSAGLPRMPLPSKPSMPNPLYAGNINHSIPATQATTHATTIMDDPFSTTNASDAVDPGLLLSRPQSAAVDADSGRLVQSGSAEAAIVRSGKPEPSDTHWSSNFREARNNARGPDRAIASSPVRALGRSGLGRSVSEGRRKKPVRRGSLPLLAPAVVRSASGPGLPVSKSTGRASGRASPSKGVPRLTSLASIPETSPHFRPGTSVRFFIDAHGRARTEATVGGGSARMARSRSSQDLVTGRGYCSSFDGEDSDDTDDEPIIIPSRNNSFHASFALPDPRKPVGSIFQSSTRSTRTRSISERSNSNSANEAESEAEMMMDEKPGKVGDATSELRRVVQDRQKRSLRLGTSSFLRRSLNTSNLGSFPGGIMSPTSLTESSHGPDSCGVRCVCNNSRGGEGEAFMVQCESCEMWLHGQCINITRRTMPSIYICGFCANTPNAARRRAREYERDNALGIGTNTSPLANKSIRSFR
ncbi:hypothetical protein E4U42_005009 [Claviceps africana]|uniref:PHD-type domain-containing protein n=1 Tax=Claviceps africana TaxID=83212 RepID=A0A8K0NGL4_9HYPO|nr:hypothetical protein E4U42_005009 [Claviceps africana]